MPKLRMEGLGLSALVWLIPWLTLPEIERLACEVLMSLSRRQKLLLWEYLMPRTGML